MEEFLIGEQVQWKVGNMECKGIVYEDTGEDELEVMCREVNFKPAKTKIKVKRNLLSKI